MPIKSDSDMALARRTQGRRALRLGIGVTLTFLLALAFDWTLAYLAPVFAAPMLQKLAVPSLKSAIEMLLVTVVIMLMCMLAGGISRAYPVFFLAALFPVLHWTFRYGLRDGSPVVLLLLLLGLMVLPMVANTDAEITRKVAGSFVSNIGVSLLVAYLMFGLFPSLPSESQPVPKPALPEAEVNRRAWILTVLTGSYLVAYFSFEWTNVHTPLYIAIYAYGANLARGLTVSKGILVANVAAGILALLMYELTVMTPYHLFIVALALTVNMALARMITSGAPWAPLAGFALSVVMILYGESIIPFSDEGGANFIDRMGELGMAAVYAITGLYVLDVYFPEKKRVAGTNQGAVAAEDV